MIKIKRDSTIAHYSFKDKTLNVFEFRKLTIKDILIDESLYKISIILVIKRVWLTALREKNRNSCLNISPLLVFHSKKKLIQFHFI